MLGVEGLRLVLGRGRRDGLVPPQVAAVGPLDVDAGPVDHQHVLDGVGAGDGFVDRCLDGCCGAASPLAVDGDDELGLGVVDARA